MQPLVIGRDLRKGYPMSLLLFMIYLHGLEHRLKKTARKCGLTYFRPGEKVTQTISGIMYAGTDDNMQELMTIYGRGSHKLGLNFSAEKSEGINGEASFLKVQGKESRY